MSSERIIAQCIACNHRQELTEKPSPPVKCSECGNIAQVYTSRQMTPQEQERYGMTKPVSRNSDGQRVKPPVARRESFTTKEDNSMQVTAPSKIDFLQQIAAGKSINKVEREWNMSPGALHYWVGKWDLKGIKPERAQQLLDEATLDGGEVPPPQNEATEMPSAQEPQEDKDAEIERLRKELANTIGQRNQLSEQVAALNQSLVEADMTIQSLKSKRVVQASPSADPFPIVTLTYALVDFGSDYTSQRKKALEEAEELIDELETAAIDLKRTVAELYDAGQAFVGLIRKQLQELCVEDVDATVQRYFAEHNRRHIEKMAAKIAGAEAERNEG